MASVADTRFKLNTGAEIPALGLGTWQSSPEEVEAAVTHALDVGYRHIDTAFGYQNEVDVGRALNKAFASGKVKREEVFVTTKLWCTYADRVEEGFELSLKNLGLDYIDLYLVHWPIMMNPKGNHPLFPRLADGVTRDIIHTHNHINTWKAMEKLLATGKVKAIGVSNYSKRYLEQLLPEATVVPAVNQIENHPALPQDDIVDFCKEKGIVITAYSPLGSTGSPLFTAEPIVEISKKRNVSPAVVLLSWHIARGSAVLAKSVKPERIAENYKLIKLDDEDLGLIKKYSDDLAAKNGVIRFLYPPFGVDFGFPDKS